MNLKLLPADGDLVRLETNGTVSRDISDPMANLCGAGIYSHQVLLSLSHTMYMDSSGIDWLINCHRRFQKQGGRLVVHSLNPATLQLLKMMRLDRVLEVEPNEVAARQRLSRPQIDNQPAPPPNGAATAPNHSTNANNHHEHH